MCIRDSFAGESAAVAIVAAFDIDPDLTDHSVHGCRCFHARGMETAAAVDAVIGEVGVDVEGGDDGHGGGLAGEVSEDGAPEVADADEGHVLAVRRSQKAADALDAGAHVVAAVGAAGVADHHEVAAHLGGADDGVAGELVGVDAFDALVVQRGQQPPVAAHPSYGLARYHVVPMLPEDLTHYVRYGTNAVKSVTSLLLLCASVNFRRAGQDGQTGPSRSVLRALSWRAPPLRALLISRSTHGGEGTCICRPVHTGKPISSGGSPCRTSPRT